VDQLVTRIITIFTTNPLARRNIAELDTVHNGIGIKKSRGNIARQRRGLNVTNENENYTL
jgi:hypothetical protein